MAKAQLRPVIVHLVEPDARTYCGRFVSVCGALVDYRDEGRRLEHQLAVDCPQCLAKTAVDDGAITDLQELR